MFETSENVRLQKAVGASRFVGSFRGWHRTARIRSALPPGKRHPFRIDRHTLGASDVSGRPLSFRMHGHGIQSPGTLLCRMDAIMDGAAAQQLEWLGMTGTGLGVTEREGGGVPRCI